MLFFYDKLKGDRVHTEPLTSRLWTIIEHMTKMPSTTCADDLGSFHQQTPIRLQHHRLGSNR